MGPWNPYVDIIRQLENDLGFVGSAGSFDGMILVSNVSSLKGANLSEVIEGYVEQILNLYKFNGGQGFANEDRPELARLLKTLIKELKKIKV